MSPRQPPTPALLPSQYLQTSPLPLMMITLKKT